MESIENENIKFWVQDNTLFSKFKKNISLNKHNVKEIIELRHTISKNEKQYWCCHINDLQHFSKDGQQYAAEYGQEFIHACGVVIYSHLAKFFINVFIRVQKPHVPIKYFTAENKALQWLEEQRKKNK